MPAPNKKYKSRVRQEKVRITTMPKSDSFSVRVRKVAETERELAERLDALQKKYPKAFDELEKINKLREEVDAEKADIKKYLEANKDYDTHDEGTVRVSLTKTVRVEVEDLEAVPNDYKELKQVYVPDIKKAEEECRIFGRVPAGFKDKSYTRMFWKLQ